jgi:hypothetical protein
MRSSTRASPNSSRVAPMSRQPGTSRSGRANSITSMGSSCTSRSNGTSRSTDASSAQCTSSQTNTVGSPTVDRRSAPIPSMYAARNASGARPMTSSCSQGSRSSDSSWAICGPTWDAADPRTVMSRSRIAAGSVPSSLSPSAARTMPSARAYGTSCPYETHRASNHGTGGSVACRRNSVASRDLPIPGSPRRTATRPRPARTARSAWESRLSSASRPTIGLLRPGTPYGRSCPPIHAVTSYAWMGVALPFSINGPRGVAFTE